MKRFALIIFSLAVLTGALAPVTASFTATNILEVKNQTVQAKNDNGGGPPPPGLTPPPTTPTPVNDNGNNSAIMNNISCGTVFGSFAGCIEYILYFIPYTIGGWLMMAGAYILDSTASLTLSSTLYSQSTFIGDGWKLTRDFSNIFFIIILLFIALSLVLGIEIGHANPKKMLASVILIAVLINFSMFIADVVIDLSNSLALVFYNQITILNPPPVDPKAPPTPNGEVPPKSITTALVQAFQPQELQSKDFWDGLKSGHSSNTHVLAGVATGAAIGSVVLPVIGTALGAVIGGLSGYFITTESTEVPATVMMGVLILVGGMFCVVAYSFLIAAISFVGRLVGLWVAIIFAPLAFVSYIIPSTRNIEGFGWSKWWESLITMAFGAPIYFFFLLLISMMTKSSMVKMSGTSFQILIALSIAFMFLIVMLVKATSYAKKASGELGAMALKVAGALGGLALMAASGGASRILSRTVGAAAKNRLTEEREDLAAGNVTGKTTDMVLKNVKDPAREAALRAMNADEFSRSAEFTQAQRDMAKTVKRDQKLASRSFDFRQTAAGNAFSSATGIGMEGFKFGDKSFLHSSDTAGGWEGIRNRKAAKDRAFAESLGANHDQQVALDDEVSDTEEKIEQAEAKLKQLRATYPPGDPLIVSAQLELNDLKVGKITAPGDVIQAAQVGTTIPGSTYVIQATDVGKTNKRWTTADVGTKKANGDPVSERDVQMGAVRTDAMGFAEKKKLADRNKDARKMSYLHQQMVQSNYEVHGEKYDNLGQIKKMGHMDYAAPLNVEVMRGWRNSFGKNVMKGFKDGAVAGAIAGAPLMAGAIGTAITGGVLGAMKEAMRMAPKIMPGKNIYTQRYIDAKGASLAADFKHEIHEFTSKYKTQGKNFFADLFGGGGGHSDSGHGKKDTHTVHSSN